MKKSLIILLFCFILAGCSNKLSIDFNDQIDTKIEFSFNSNEYREHYNSSSNDVSDEIEAIINEVRPLNDSYDEMFKEVKYENNNGSFNGEYTYTYTYSNFKDNAILKKCFEYAAVEEENNKIFVYLKGHSDCAPFELRVKADNRMLSNNANTKENNEYIWKVESDNNDIHFNISKEIIKNNLFSLSNILYLLLAIIMILVILILKKKNKNSLF